MININEAYTSPGHPAAFSGVNNVRRYHGSKISQKKITNELEKINAFTLHRRKNKPKFYNPILVYTKREQIQMDLIDVERFHRQNKGVKFLLVVIDVFTKKASVIGMKRKTQEKTLEAIKIALEDQLPPLPQTVAFDKGSEFMNTKIKNYLKQHNIKQFNLTGTHKASIAERFNRTLQALIYKYMTHNNTKKYIEALPKLIDTYNNRFHSSIKMTPNEAEKQSNHALVRQNLGIKHSIALSNASIPILMEGDLVRVSLSKIGPKTSFRRGYTKQFSDKLYTIILVKTNLPIPMYKVEDENGRILDKSFYKSDLQKVNI
jgi:transposase InsO family protein